MFMKNAREIWRNCCDAVVRIEAQHGPDAAIDYLVGDKLMTFAEMADRHHEFRDELPAFSARIRTLFDREALEAHFARAEDASRVEPDLLTFASADDIAEMKDSLEFDRDLRERRAWVRAMLLRTAS